MPDIFISYSRRDGDFGKKLHQTFVGQQKDIWMDWEDIPLTADWWTEIRRGIETSDNFVLIMSPDSVGSPVCQLEIEYARQLNKRIVPIFHRDPQFEQATISVVERAKTDEHLRRMMDGRDPAQLMEANKKLLATLNWVFFKPEDNFDEKFHQLSQIVDADLTHIRQHTRLQVKALEWVESSKNISFVLDGDELTAAETWLAAGADKQPQATELHREFIAASRKTENARRRLMRGLQIASLVAGVLIILATGMALFSVNQANTANERADYAASQVALAETAQSDAEKSAAASAAQVTVIAATLAPIPSTLTAVAEQIIEGENYARAMRFSGEAIAQNQDTTADARSAALLAIRSLNYQYTGLADNTLLAALDRFYLTRSFGDNSYLFDLEFLPDGRLLTAGDGLILWDTAAGEPVTTLVSPGEDAFTDAVLSPDGSRLLALKQTPDWQVVAWTLAGDTLTPLTATLPPEFAGILDVLFDSTGTPYLLIQDANALCRLWNPLSGAWAAFEVDCLDAVFSPDGRWIAFQSLTELTIYPVQGGAAAITLPAGNNMVGARQFVFSPDGRQMAVAKENNIELWTIPAGRLSRTLNGHTDQIFELYFTPDSETLISLSADSSIRLWDVRSGQLWRTLPARETTTMTLSQDGQQLVSIQETVNRSQTMVNLWNINRQSSSGFHAGNGTINMLAFSSDSRYLAGNSSTDLAVYDLNSQTLVFTSAIEVAQPEFNVTTVFQPGGSLLALMSADDIRLIDFITGEERHLAAWSLDQAGYMQFTPDGTRLVVAGYRDGNITVWDVATGEQIAAWHFEIAAGSFIDPIRISPDSQTLLVGMNQTATAWNLATGEQASVTETPWSGEALFSTFYGKRYVTTQAEDSDGFDTYIVDTSTNEFETLLAKQPYQPVATTFSPDFTLLALTDYNRTIQLFDAATRSQVRVLNGPATFYTVAISPDGNWLAGGTSGGEVRVWHVQVEDSIAYACERLAGYDFNTDERTRYDLDESPTCP